MASDRGSQPSLSPSLSSSVTHGQKRGAAPHATQTSSFALKPSTSESPDASASASASAGAPADIGSASGDVAKKRRIGPGSRGVANLTPEQLAKKRANDREAQRAIRERTKGQIDKLERRIHELTSQQPYQDLQAALRAKEAVEAENADIKKRLATVMSLIQPLIGSSPDAASASASASASAPVPPPVEPSSVSPHHSFLPIHHPPNTQASAYNSSTPGSAPSPSGSADHPWQLGPSSEQQAQGKMLSQQRHDLRHNLDLGPERLDLDFLVDQTRAHRSSVSNGSHGSQDGQGGPHSYSTISKAQASPSPRRYPAPEVKNCAPSCPLDDILLDFLHARRQDAAGGLSTQELIGPRYPSVSSLLNPSHSKYSHPLSKVFTDILSTFPDLSGLPERVATLYIMFLIMRWQIAPARENFERLPAWAAPNPSQFSSEHPAWIDHIPFPRMRERLVRDRLWSARAGLFDQFFVPFTRTLSLNWPYEDTDTLLLVPDSKDVMINPVFERHLRRLENWTLGEAFAATFPELEGTYNLKTG